MRRLAFVLASVLVLTACAAPPTPVPPTAIAVPTDDVRAIIDEADDLLERRITGNIFATTTASAPTPAPTADARATELRIANNIFATATASAPTPAPTADARATELRIAGNIFATTTASAPTRVPTADARATELRIAGNIFATATASVPTRTATPQPTATQTRGYGEVFVSSVTTKSKFVLGEPIILRWDPIGDLRANDWYRVDVSADANFSDGHLVWTGTTRNAQIAVALPTFNWRYWWRIQVVESVAGTLTPISPVGPIRDLLWAP